MIGLGVMQIFIILIYFRFSDQSFAFELIIGDMYSFQPGGIFPFGVLYRDVLAHSNAYS